MTEPTPLEELKQRYNELKVKYKLPEFTELNQLFDIEDIDPETEFLIKKIRRAMSEKIGNYLRFIDILLNPSNAPIFFFKLVKKLDRDDREIIGNIYETLGNLEIQIVSMDLDYSEEKEAEFIKNLHQTFNNQIKKDFLKIIEKLNSDEDNSKRVNGSYLG